VNHTRGDWGSGWFAFVVWPVQLDGVLDRLHLDGDGKWEAMGFVPGSKGR
jgi:hypothetical protein